MYPEEIILHIGKGKTGSTSIQHFLRTNKNILESHGYLSLLTQIPELDYQLTDFSDCLKLNNTIVQIYDICQKQKIKKVLWSNETFEHLTTEAIQCFPKVFKNAQFKIIVYLRRQDKWIQSAYCQWGIEHKIYPGKMKSFEAFYSQRIEFSDDFSLTFEDQLDYLSLLERWAAIFGHEHIIVQPYEKEQLLNNLVNNFISLSGLPVTAPFELNDITHNSTFNQDIYEMIRVYNAQYEGQNYPNDLIAFLRNTLGPKWLKKRYEQFSLISPEKQLAIIEKFQASNSEIARKYLHRDDGQLFYEPLPDPDEPFELYEGLTLNRLVLFILDVFIHQDKLLRAQDERCNRLEWQISRINNKLEKMPPSRSWRITEPFRALAGFFRKVIKKRN